MENVVAFIFNIGLYFVTCEKDRSLCGGVTRQQQNPYAWVSVVISEVVVARLRPTAAT